MATQTVGSELWRWGFGPALLPHSVSRCSASSFCGLGADQGLGHKGCKAEHSAYSPGLTGPQE